MSAFVSESKSVSKSVLSSTEVFSSSHVAKATTARDKARDAPTPFAISSFRRLQGVALATIVLPSTLMLAAALLLLPPPNIGLAIVWRLAGKKQPRTKLCTPSNAHTRTNATNNSDCIILGVKQAKSPGRGLLVEG